MEAQNQIQVLDALSQRMQVFMQSICTGLDDVAAIVSGQSAQIASIPSARSSEEGTTSAVEAAKQVFKCFEQVLKRQDLVTMLEHAGGAPFGSARTMKAGFLKYSDLLRWCINTCKRLLNTCTELKKGLSAHRHSHGVTCLQALLLSNTPIMLAKNVSNPANQESTDADQLEACRFMYFSCIPALHSIIVQLRKQGEDELAKRLRLHTGEGMLILGDHVPFATIKLLSHALNTIKAGAQHCRVNPQAASDGMGDEDLYHASVAKTYIDRVEICYERLVCKLDSAMLVGQLDSGSAGAHGSEGVGKQIEAAVQDLHEFCEEMSSAMQHCNAINDANMRLRVWVKTVTALYGPYSDAIRAAVAAHAQRPEPPSGSQHGAGSDEEASRPFMMLVSAALAVVRMRQGAIARLVEAREAVLAEAAEQADDEAEENHDEEGEPSSGAGAAASSRRQRKSASDSDPVMDRAREWQVAARAHEAELLAMQGNVQNALKIARQCADSSTSPLDGLNVMVARMLLSTGGFGDALAALEDAAQGILDLSREQDETSGDAPGSSRSAAPSNASMIVLDALARTDQSYRSLHLLRSQSSGGSWSPKKLAVACIGRTLYQILSRQGHRLDARQLQQCLPTVLRCIVSVSGRSCADFILVRLCEHLASAPQDGGMSAFRVLDALQSSGEQQRDTDGCWETEIVHQWHKVHADEPRSGSASSSKQQPLWQQLCSRSEANECLQGVCYAATRSALAQKRFKEAARLCEYHLQLLNRYAKTTAAHKSVPMSLRALAVSRTGDTDRAVETAKAAFDLSKSPQALLVLIAAHLERGSRDGSDEEAVKSLLPALSRMPGSNSRLLAYVAMQARRTESYAAAIATLETLLQRPLKMAAQSSSGWEHSVSTALGLPAASSGAGSASGISGPLGTGSEDGAQGTVTDSATYAMLWIECSMKQLEKQHASQQHRGDGDEQGQAGQSEIPSALASTISAASMRDRLREVIQTIAKCTDNPSKTLNSAAGDRLLKLACLSYTILLQASGQQGKLSRAAQAEAYELLAALLASIPSSTTSLLVARLKCVLRAMQLRLAVGLALPAGDTRARHLQRTTELAASSIGLTQEARGRLQSHLQQGGIASAGTMQAASWKAVDQQLKAAALSGANGLEVFFPEPELAPGAVGALSALDSDQSDSAASAALEVLHALAASSAAMAFHAKAAQPVSAVSNERLADAAKQLSEQYPQHPTVLGYAAAAAFKSDGRVPVAVKALALQLQVLLRSAHRSGEVLASVTTQLIRCTTAPSKKLKWIAQAAQLHADSALHPPFPDAALDGIAVDCWNFGVSLLQSLSYKPALEFLRQAMAMRHSCETVLGREAELAHSIKVVQALAMGRSPPARVVGQLSRNEAAAAVPGRSMARTSGSSAPMDAADAAGKPSGAGSGLDASSSSSSGDGGGDIAMLAAATVASKAGSTAAQHAEGAEGVECGGEVEDPSAAGTTSPAAGGSSGSGAAIASTAVAHLASDAEGRQAVTGSGKSPQREAAAAAAGSSPGDQEGDEGAATPKKKNSNEYSALHGAREPPARREPALGKKRGREDELAGDAQEGFDGDSAAPRDDTQQKDAIRADEHGGADRDDLEGEAQEMDEDGTEKAEVRASKRFRTEPPAEL